MNSRRRALQSGLLAIVLLCGCQRRDAALELTSYKDPYFPETFSLRLDRSGFHRDPSGDLHVAGYSTSAIGATDGDIEQYLHVHMFWRPTPGRTPDNPTSIDATLVYVIVTGKGVLVYRGTGYVYPQSRRFDDQRLIARIESGRLRLDRFFGEPPDVLGDARLTGTIDTRADAALALDIRRTIDRRTASE